MSLVCLKNKRIWEGGAQEWKGVGEAGRGQSQSAHRRVSKGVAYCLPTGNCSACSVRLDCAVAAHRGGCHHCLLDRWLSVPASLVVWSGPSACPRALKMPVESHLFSSTLRFYVLALQAPPSECQGAQLMATMKQT